MKHRNNVDLSLFIQLAKVSKNKMNEKRSHEYQSMDPEYVTGQINSCILELLLSVLISYSFCSLISVSKKWNIETMLTFPYSCNWQKLAKAKWMKKEAMSIRVWTLNMQLGKLIVVFYSFFWDDFIVWILHRLKNLNLL